MYKILMHNKTYEKAKAYKRKYFSTEEMIELLMRTKHTQIFAEFAIAGDGSDWTQEELSILGDIGIAAPVTVYDNGHHFKPMLHKEPFEATLLFVPGALLCAPKGVVPADWDEVVVNGEIDPEAYYQLYERRLLPALRYANNTAKEKGKMAFITIPGVGCGQFAGTFKGELGEKFKDVLIKLLKTHTFPNVQAVYYDPYAECENERYELNGVSFFVRPLTKGNENKSQLCKPGIYGDDFSDCDLYSVVAWDHVSWPGNDFYGGLPNTDDGVKAAATNVMKVMTGIEGEYNSKVGMYQPPLGYYVWDDVVKWNDIQLEVKENIIVF